MKKLRYIAGVIGLLTVWFSVGCVEKFEAKYGKKPVIIDVVIGDGARKLC